MARTNWELTKWLARDCVEITPHAEEIGNYNDVNMFTFERLPDFEKIVAHTKEFVESSKEYATTSQIEDGIFDDLDEIDWVEQAYLAWDMYWSDRMEMGFFDPTTGEWLLDPYTFEPIVKAAEENAYDKCCEIAKVIAETGDFSRKNELVETADAAGIQISFDDEWICVDDELFRFTFERAV